MNDLPELFVLEHRGMATDRDDFPNSRVQQTFPQNALANYAGGPEEKDVRVSTFPIIGEVKTKRPGAYAVPGLSNNGIDEGKR
jgi:hypothetical protein